MATHSSILAWEIPWPEDPGGLEGCKRIRHDLAAKPLQLYVCHMHNPKLGAEMERGDNKNELGDDRN